MLDPAALAEIAAATAAGDQPQALLKAIDRAATGGLGAALVTAMRFDAAAMQVRRLYSSDPASYPPGGFKRKRDTAWGEQVLIRRELFVGEGEAAIRSAFDDHETILGLGLRAVVNVPVVFRDACLGTVNFLIRRERFAPGEIALARLLGLLATPALMTPD